MDRYSGHKSAGAQLYPTIDPFDQQILHVDGGHQIYFEQCGCSEGIPVVVLHGGPGGGCSPSMRRYFDPKIYRIILFDQRGCGRSQPHACLIGLCQAFSASPNTPTIRLTLLDAKSSY